MYGVENRRESPAPEDPRMEAIVLHRCRVREGLEQMVQYTKRADSILYPAAG